MFCALFSCHLHIKNQLSDARKWPFCLKETAVLRCKRQYFVIQKTLFEYAKAYISSLYVNIIYLQDYLYLVALSILSKIYDITEISLCTSIRRFYLHKAKHINS